MVGRGRRDDQHHRADGGAIGIAALTALEVGAAERITENRLVDRGVEPTAQQIDVFKEYLLQAEQAGRSQVPVDSKVVRVAIHDNLLAHVDSYRLTFLTTTGIAQVGALICLLLVRKEDRFLPGAGVRTPLALDRNHARRVAPSAAARP